MLWTRIQRTRLWSAPMHRTKLHLRACSSSRKWGAWIISSVCSCFVLESLAVVLCNAIVCDPKCEYEPHPVYVVLTLLFCKCVILSLVFLTAFWKKWFSSTSPRLNIHHKLPSLGQLILSFPGAIAFLTEKWELWNFNTSSLGLFGKLNPMGDFSYTWKSVALILIF